MYDKSWAQEVLDNDKATELQWWGYVTTSGYFSVKRYFRKSQIEGAAESDFIKLILGPVEAPSQTEAMIKMFKCMEIDDLVTVC